ncbi:MAG TPA: DUF4365 domain-containing protein [Candidatus Sphingomonas excrementigallinarum]|nr:DUF4365 domain-containing protein [Candidatus Sphingomonas excrementigallinarum]
MTKLPLPSRTRQKKSEAASFAILQYKLGDLGIFRGQTENDYGIDVDFELEIAGNVTGKSVKIQVKSSENLKLRADGAPSVGGIKQSTLNYWCQISFRTSVMAYAVDLASEKIYVTGDLFWQATKLLDGGESTKSITFLPEGKNNLALATVLTVLHAWKPTIGEVVAAHTTALRRLKAFLEIYVDAFHYDAGTPIENMADFSDLIDVCRILMWKDGEKLFDDKQDRSNWQSVAYWKAKSEADGWDGLSCIAAQPILSALLPALVRKLQTLRATVLAGKYFWAHEKPSYLALVYETTLPAEADEDTLHRWGYHFDQQAQVVVGSGEYFAAAARISTAKPRKARAKRKTEAE